MFNDVEANAPYQPDNVAWPEHLCVWCGLGRDVHIGGCEFLSFRDFHVRNGDAAMYPPLWREDLWVHPELQWQKFAEAQWCRYIAGKYATTLTVTDAEGRSIQVNREIAIAW